MRKRKKSMLALVIITAFMAAALFLPGLVSAGDLDPSGPPTTGTMHTLEEIYEVVTDTNSKVNGGASCEGAPVEKTGQTTFYATGDDVDLEKGVAWPNPRFMDNGDGTVTDNLTGLIWLKNANRFGSRSWLNALNDCNTLADDGSDLTDGSTAGDWRLPNVKELQSLIDFGQYGPALPSGYPFSGVQSGVYWSSTTYEGHTTYAWLEDMRNGGELIAPKYGGHYVWPVRSDN